MKLDGQVALITGAGRGIGRGIALRFAAEGADIAIFDVNAESGEGTAGEVRAQRRKGIAHVVDVSDQDQVVAGVEDVAQALGRIDVLVNCAGIDRWVPFLDMTREDWDRNIQVNLSGTFFCTQAAARHMATRKYGRIINFSSVAGLMGSLDDAGYSAAKAGVVGLTRAASLDLADFGITVNAIAPGPIDTELLRTALTPEVYAERPQHLPIARLGTVDEIALAAVFLASPDSGFITGTTLVVDGGSVAAGAYMVEKYRRRKGLSRSNPG